MSSVVSNPFFVIESPRSGSTFLTNLLVSHVNAIVPPESNIVTSILKKFGLSAIQSSDDLESVLRILAEDPKFADWDIPVSSVAQQLKAKPYPISLRDIIGGIFGMYCCNNDSHQRIFGLKKGPCALHFAELARIFPECKFIGIIRDGRAVFNSQKKSIVSTTGKPFESSPVVCAQKWQGMIRLFRSISDIFPDRIRIIHYESLVQEPERNLKELASFLGQEYSAIPVDGKLYAIPDRYKDLHENVKRPPDISRIHAWQNELPPAEIATFERIASHTLEQEGYALHQHPDAKTPVSLSCNSKHPVVYMPVNVHHSLHSRLLLGSYAVQRGYRCMVGKSSLVLKKALSGPAGIYLEKSLAKGKVRHLAQLVAIGHRIVCLDEVGDVCDNLRQYQKQRLFPGMPALYDRLLACGELHRDAIHDVYPDATEKVVVTGTPRMDLMMRPFREVYRNASCELRDRFGRFLFLPGICNINEGSAPGDEGMTRQYRSLVTPAEQDFFRRRNAHIDKSLQRFFALLPQLREVFPDHTIVIRPQSSEQSKRWAEAVGELDRIVVESHGSIAPYLLGADCLLHHGSTAAIEGYFAGTPLVAYLPDYNAEFDSHPSNELSHRAFTPDEAIDIVRGILNGSPSPKPDTQKSEQGYFAHLHSTKTASESVVDVFDSFDLPEHEVTHAFFCKEQFNKTNLSKRIKKTIKDKLSWIFRNLRDSSTAGTSTEAHQYKKRKWPGSSIAEVEHILGLFSNVEPSLLSVRVKQVDNNVFYLYKEDME